MELQGKKALIIGASRGIGEAIALAFVKEGAEVVIAGRAMETLNAVKEKILQYGGKLHCLELDIKDVSKAEDKI